MMKHMKGKFFAALLVCVLAGLWAAPAHAYPKWVGVSGKWSIVRNEKQKDVNAKNYKQLRCDVTYTNNSKDRVITAIFNKTISMSGTLRVRWDTGLYGPENITASTKSSNVTKMELYPGQSKTFYYILTIDKIPYLSRFNQYGAELKIIKWGHDFQVSTQKLTVE